MSCQKQHKNLKIILSAVFFVILAAMTYITIFQSNDTKAVGQAILDMDLTCLAGAALIAVAFVSIEGVIIWYLMHALKNPVKLLQCVKYSFVGFFFSGITPSATGGQPAQLYCMKKEGLKISESTVVLMTAAVLYKFVLVIMGIGILVFWHDPLAVYMGNYMWLYYVGLFLNTALVAVLLFIMIEPRCFKNMAFALEKGCVRLHLLKPSGERRKKLEDFVERYRETVQFLIANPGKIVVSVLLTVIQRCSVFSMTYLVYLGFQQSGTGILEISALQASIYIAVDMLPLPGSQGITEIMYRRVFGTIFGSGWLTASMCVTRGINFYFLMLISALITGGCYFRYSRSLLQSSKRRRVCRKSILSFRKM